MTYTFNSDLSWIILVVQWHIAGQSWAEIASKVNKPAHELEELPFRCADQWVAALSQLMAIKQQEATLKALQQIQTTMATTTDPKTLASLVTALTRLLKTMPTNKHEPPPHPPVLATKSTPEPVAPATPTPTPTPMKKPAEPMATPAAMQAMIQEKLSSDDLTRFFRLRHQFNDFGLFLQELAKREPAIYQKLQANNLLPADHLNPRPTG